MLNYKDCRIKLTGLCFNTTKQATKNIAWLKHTMRNLGNYIICSEIDYITNLTFVYYVNIK